MNIYSLYIHVPFCEKKCDYCSFYSVIKNDFDISLWLKNLEKEIENLYKNFGLKKIPLRTIYFGGGTPSVLQIHVWEKIIYIIKKFFDLKNLEEATVEANPNSLSENLISIWKNSFFTRISLGVQSMNDSELKFLGRLHDSEKAKQAMKLLKNSGLDFNVDLIFGIPEQTIRSWNKSLNEVIDSGANHISTYQLTLEPDTPLGKKFKYKNYDLNSHGYYFYRYAQFFLERKNFIQYEISNFAIEGHECRHNLAYWKQENVIALGPGAWGYIDGMRYKNPENFTFDEKKFIEKLNKHESAIEFAILSLRTKWGIEKKEFIFKFGEKILQKIEEKLSEMPENLFCNTQERIALSKKGMRVGNYIWSELIDI